MASKGGLRYEIVKDPYKTAVSSPLSEFLSRSVGKGLPGYTESTGKSLYEPLDSQVYNRYQEFIGVDAGDWYDKAVYAPAMKSYKEETLPLLREAHAGQLSSSRFDSALTESATDLSEALAQGRYQAELEIPKAQYAMGRDYAESKTRELQLEYADWMKSLPEYNPVLGQALQFLQSDSGYNILSYLDPGKGGKGGILGGTLGMAIGALLALPTGGMSVLGGAALGGALGGGAGMMFDN